MDRPVCNTCPYWEADSDVVTLGHCLRYPPVFAASDSLFDEWQGVDTNPYLGIQPETEGHDTCGEHPDFPAFIDGLRMARE